MNKINKKKLLNYIIAPLLLIILLFLIYKQISARGSLKSEWDNFLIYFQRGNKTLFVLVLLLGPVNWMMEAKKWQWLLQKIEPLPFRRAFASTLTGIAFALITPNKIGDFAGRILYLSNKTKLRGAIATLIGNLAQTTVVFMFGIIGLIYFNIYFPGNWQLIALILAILGASFLLYFYLNISILARWSQRFPKLRTIVIAMRVLKRYSKRDLIKILTISFLRFCVYNIQFLMIINIFGAGVPWVVGFFISGLMFWFITVIPSLFIADLGVRGFLAGLLFTDTGLSHNAVSVLAGSYSIWILNLVIPAIIGSILILFVRIFR